MKLGSFWGLTAPMLMLAKDKIPKETCQRYMSVLNVAGNTVFLVDVQKELKYLYEYITNFPFSLGIDEEISSDFQVLDGVTVKHGVVEDSDVLFLLEDAIVYSIGMKICKDLQKGNAKYSASKLQFPEHTKEVIQNKVRVFIQENDIECDKLNAVSLKVLKEFKGDTLEECIAPKDLQKVAEVFNLVATVPDKILRNGVEVTLGKLEKRYLLYLKENIGYLEECLRSVKISCNADIPIFDTTFQAFIHRKPTSLYYMVVKKFDYLKTNNVSMLNTVLKESISNLQRLKESVNKYVVADSEAKDVLTAKQFDEIVSTYDSSKQVFFSNLLKEHYIYVEDLMQGDLALLSELYDCFINFDLIYFANVLGVDSLSCEDFDLFNSKMQQIGVYGLNRCTFELFREFIQSVVLVTTNSISKTEEQLADLNRVLEDVQALLDSIRPIGGDLSV